MFPNGGIIGPVNPFTPPSLIYVGGTSYGGGGGTDTPSMAIDALTGGVATAPAIGDLVILNYACGCSADVTGLSATGYTSLGRIYSDDSYDVTMFVGYKILDAADTSITLSSTGSTSNERAAAVHVWRNFDPNSPFDATAVEASGINTGNADPSSITTVTPGAVVIAIGAYAYYYLLGTRTFSSGPSGYSNFETGAGTGTVEVNAGIASLVTTTPQSYDPGAFTASTDSTQWSWAAMTLAIKPQVSSGIWHLSDVLKSMI